MREASLVGATRFERATSSTPWKRATKLRHAPTREKRPERSRKNKENTPISERSETGALFAKFD